MGSGVLVVSECDAGPDEHIVFNGYSRWDEDERSDLAVVAYLDSLFDVDECVYLGVFSDGAAVEV